MFYDEQVTMKVVEEEPSQIFDLINENEDSILMIMLKKGWYEVVLKHMKNKEWQVNHQNKQGETFAHILVTKNYREVLEIIKQLQKNKNFIPNIRNKKGETILDKSINEHYIYTTVKILEDNRFNNIDLISFKKLYENYIRSNNYGIYSKMNNLEIIIDNLVDKELLPKVEKIVNTITKNFEEIKNHVQNNEIKYLDNIVYSILQDV